MTNQEPLFHPTTAEERAARQAEVFGKNRYLHPQLREDPIDQSRVRRTETQEIKDSSPAATQLELGQEAGGMAVAHSVVADLPADHDMPIEERTTEGRPIPNFDDKPTYDYDLNTRTSSAQIADPYADNRR